MGYSYYEKPLLPASMCLYGCTNRSALNFRIGNQESNRSCLARTAATVIGCMRSNAINYLPTATNPGVCGPNVLRGCTGSSFVNYNPLANVNDGSCHNGTTRCSSNSTVEKIPGHRCDVQAVCMFVGNNRHECRCPFGLVGNGSVCAMARPGCMDARAKNYNASANVQSATPCQYYTDEFLCARQGRLNTATIAVEGSNVDPQGSPFMSVSTFEDCARLCVALPAGLCLSFNWQRTALRCYLGRARAAAGVQLAMTSGFEYYEKRSEAMCRQPARCTGAPKCNQFNGGTSTSCPVGCSFSAAQMIPAGDGSRCQLTGNSWDNNQKICTTQPYRVLSHRSNHSCVLAAYAPATKSCVVGCTTPNSVETVLSNMTGVTHSAYWKCTPIRRGCTDTMALNFNISANTNDRTCIYPIYGCTNQTAQATIVRSLSEQPLNLNTSATVDDGSCKYGTALSLFACPLSGALLAHNIEPLGTTAPSAEHCARLCLQRAACLSFDFSLSSKRCYLGNAIICKAGQVSCSRINSNAAGYMYYERNFTASLEYP
jgi:hypothetical protein